MQYNTIVPVADKIKTMFAAHGLGQLTLRKIRGTSYLAGTIEPGTSRVAYAELVSQEGGMPIRIVVFLQSLDTVELQLWLPDSIAEDAMLNDTDMHLRLMQPPHAFVYGVSAIIAYLASEPE